MIFKILLTISQITIVFAAPSLPPLLQQLRAVMQQAQFLQRIPNLAEQQVQLMHQIPAAVGQEWLQLQPVPGMGDKQVQQMPVFQPFNVQHPIPSLQTQGTMQQQMLALQEQMFAQQNFQALQRMGLIPSPAAMNTAPILVLFPDTVPNNGLEVRRTDFNTNNLKSQKPEVGDDDSVVIEDEAEAPEETITKVNPIRAVLLMPNTRGFIGDFISSIPFLPFEINVPDTISWIYNGITGMFTGIGQVFRPQTTNSEAQNEDVKFDWKQMQSVKQDMPIVMMRLG